MVIREPINKILLPESLSVKVGNIEITSMDLTRTQVKINGVPISARKVVLTCEVGHVNKAEVTWFPDVQHEKK